MKRLLLTTAIVLSCVLPSFADATQMDQPITRKEFVNALVTSVPMTPKVTIGVSFKDINTSDPAYANIQKAYSLGWINGSCEDTFQPDELLTREQMAAILSRVYCQAAQIDKNQLVFTSEVLFRDQGSVSDWARIDVKISYLRGFLETNADGYIRPMAIATTSEAVRGIDGVKALLTNN